jgi:predicted TIM-barrel fold metal-dependent hydrolase
MPIFDLNSTLGGSVIPGVANNAATIKATMQARGVDSAVLMSAHARLINPLAGNRMLKATVDQGEGLYGCLVTHINRVEASVAAMREMMSHKKMVAMAISAPVEDGIVDLLLADELLNAYRRYGKPLFYFAPSGAHVHMGMNIAKAFPMFKVVLIGMGGAEWRTAIAAAETTTNLYLETSGALDRAKLPLAAHSIGTNRLVFGSGSPTVDAAAALGLISDSELTEEARKKILSINAERLFGLEAN